jgi:hypothetical protein
VTQKIGFKSPPQHSQWRKGQSGNPSGRPKGKPNFATELAQELGEFINITENGRQRRITKQRALLKSLTTGGIKGDVRAANIMLNLANRLVDDTAGQPTAAELTAEDRAILKSFLDRHATPTKGDE